MVFLWRRMRRRGVLPVLLWGARATVRVIIISLYFTLFHIFSLSWYWLHWSLFRFFRFYSFPSLSLCLPFYVPVRCSPRPYHLAPICFIPLSLIMYHLYISRPRQLSPICFLPLLLVTYLFLTRITLFPVSLFKPEFVSITNAWWNSSPHPNHSIPFIFLISQRAEGQSPLSPQQNWPHEVSDTHA